MSWPEKVTTSAWFPTIVTDNRVYPRRGWLFGAPVVACPSNAWSGSATDDQHVGIRERQRFVSHVDVRRLLRHETV